jgi:hypothetical protein
MNIKGYIPGVKLHAVRLAATPASADVKNASIYTYTPLIFAWILTTSQAALSSMESAVSTNIS